MFSVRHTLSLAIIMEGREVEKERGREPITINPMLIIKHTDNYTTSKNAFWIERTTSVEHTHHLRDEQCESNANRCDERRLVLLLRQHEDNKHQLHHENSFDEYTPHKSRIAFKRSSNIQRRRKQAQHHSRHRNATGNLRNKETHEHHAECDSGFEDASRDAEEDPHVDHEREAEDKVDVEVDGDVEAGAGTGRGVDGRGGVGRGAGLDVRYLGADEGEEEEYGRADELADRGYEV